MYTDSNAEGVKYGISCPAAQMQTLTHTHALLLDFRKVTELIQTEPAGFAVAKIDSAIQVVVLQKEDQSF